MSTNQESRKKTFENVEQATTIFANIVTIILAIVPIASLLFGIFTFFTLSIQPEPIEFQSFELGITFKFIFFVCIFWSYIAALKTIWKATRERNQETESKFKYYVFAAFKLKRPVILAGFLVLLATGVGVFPEFASVIFLLIILMLFITGFNHLESRTSEVTWLRKLKWSFDGGFHKIWEQRIKNRLSQSEGYVNSADFYDMNIKVDEINFALQQYFDEHEFSQNLRLKVIKKEFYFDVYELRFSNLETKLPDIEEG